MMERDTVSSCYLGSETYAIFNPYYICSQQLIQRFLSDLVDILTLAIRHMKYIK